MVYHIIYHRLRISVYISTTLCCKCKTSTNFNVISLTISFGFFKSLSKKSFFDFVLEFIRFDYL